MTNGRVDQSVAGNDGPPLLIKYKDGEKKVLVSAETPVVTYVPADKSDLKAGAKGIAFMKKLPDGSFETNRVRVRRDGLTRPLCDKAGGQGIGSAFRWLRLVARCN